MSISAALSNVPFFHRTGARFERFDNEDPDNNRNNSIVDDEEEERLGNTSAAATARETLSSTTTNNTTTTTRASSTATTNNSNMTSHPLQNDDGIEQSEGDFINNNSRQQFDIENGLQSRLSVTATPNNNRTGNRTSVASGDDNDDDDSTNIDFDQADGIHRFSTISIRPTSRSGATTTGTTANGTTTTTMTLAELEEERELARRRSSACVLFALFVLFRLWIMALQEGDFGLLMLCLIGTSWTIRWIRYNQEQAEELSRAIANYSDNQATSTGSNNTDGTGHRHDLRMLSFQGTHC